jgi:hypothetical protein
MQASRERAASARLPVETQREAGSLRAFSFSAASF